MRRDEIYRRAMLAALAVTGRKLARVSLGLCIAGAGTGCIEDPGAEEPGRIDSMIADLMPDATGVSGPDMGPVQQDLSLAQVDISVFPEEDSALTDVANLERDEGMFSDPDGSEPEPDAAAMADMDVEETCLPEEGMLTDWRCCEGHGFDQTIPGCTPCNVREDRSQWADCVTCDGSGDQGSQDGQEGVEEYMACCDAVSFDFNMGCIAWGPPAPPEFDGRTLTELLNEMLEIA